MCVCVCVCVFITVIFLEISGVTSLCEAGSIHEANSSYISIASEENNAGNSMGVP